MAVVEESVQPVFGEGLQSRAGDGSSASELSPLLQAFYFFLLAHPLLPILYFESFALLPHAKCGCPAKNQVAFLLLSFLSSKLCYLDPLPFCPFLSQRSHLVPLSV